MTCHYCDQPAVSTPLPNTPVCREHHQKMVHAIASFIDSLEFIDSVQDDLEAI
jgi:hypothetical protein